MTFENPNMVAMAARFSQEAPATRWRKHHNWKREKPPVYDALAHRQGRTCLQGRVHDAQGDAVMPTHLDEYAEWLAAHMPGVPDEIVFSLAELALVQPKGRVLCACNRSWMHLDVAERFPHVVHMGHGWEDCRA